MKKFAVLREAVQASAHHCSAAAAQPIRATQNRCNCWMRASHMALAGCASIRALLLLLVLAFANPASAATNTFQTGTRWSTGADWSSGNPPAGTDALLFSQSYYAASNSGALIPNNTLDGSFTIQTLSFDTGADVFGIDANASGSTTAQTLTFNGGTNALGTADLIYLSPTTTGTVTIGNTAGRGSLTLAFGSNTGTINVANAAASLVLGVNSVVTGTNGLAKNGSGTLTLSGTNSFTGGTTVNGGTLVLGNGTNATSLVGFNQPLVSSTSQAPSGGVAVTVTNPAIVQVQAHAAITGGAGAQNNGAPTPVGSAGTGGAAVVFNGAGSLLNAGSITGGVGGQQSGNASSSSTGGQGATAVVFANGGSFTNSGTILGGQGGQGAGFYTPSGNGGAGVSLSGAGTYSNFTSIAGGMGGSGSQGAGNGGIGLIFSSSSTFINSGTITGGNAGGGSNYGGSGGAGTSVTNGGTINNSGSIAGGNGTSGAVSAGSGSAGVSFSNDGALINSGTISGGAPGTPQNSFTTPGTHGNGVVFSGTAGTLTNAKGGTIADGVVMGNFANNVTLQIGSHITGGLNSGTNSASMLTLTDDGSGGAQLYSTAVSGTTTFSGQLIKTGRGTWTLDQSFSYAGGTTINSGTLAITGTAGTPGSNFTVDGSAANNPAGTLSGSGRLSAANAYIGNTNGNTGSFIQSGGTNTIGSVLHIGTSAGSSGTYSLSSGSLSASDTFVGLQGTGSFIQSGGTNNTDDTLGIGNGPGSSGTYSLSSGSLSAIITYVGNSGTGSFIQSGGTNAVTDRLILGSSPGSTGTYSLSSGSLSAANTTYVGYSGTGSFIQSGGTNTVDSQLILGFNAGGSGTYSLSAGLLSAPATVVGFSGTGSFIQSGGTNTVSSQLVLGNLPGGNGTYNLSGSGVLSAGQVLRISGAGTFNFNGGTLQARANHSSFMQGLTAANVQAGGAKVDTNGFDVTIAQSLAHDPNLSGTDGGLIKTGSGTLTLSASNGFIGDVVVKAGTLALSAAKALGLIHSAEVDSGGTLRFDTSSGGGNHINSSAPVALNGGRLAVNNAISNSSETMGALTLSSNSSLDFGTGSGNRFSFASLSLSGTLNVTGWSGSSYAPGATSDPGTNESQDRLLFSSDPGFGFGTLIPTISFFNDAGAFLGNGQEVSFNGQFEIVPAPEPTTILGALGLLGLVGWRERRRAACVWRALRVWRC